MAGLLGLVLGSGEAMAANLPRLVSVSGPFAASASNSQQAKVNAGGLDASARSILLEQAGVRISSLSLGESKTISLTGGRQIVRVAQTHQGIPVVFGGGTVVFSAESSAERATFKWIDDLPSSVEPSVGAASAAEVASKATKLPASAEQAKLVIWTVADVSFLAWLVKPSSLPGLAYEPMAVVDAKTGALVAHFNTAKHAIPKGTVYETNPVKSPMLMDVELPLADGAVQLKNTLIESFNCVDKKTTKNIDPGFGIPIAVHVCELVHSEMPDANGNFTFAAQPPDNEPEDPFSQVQMFHHVNRIYSYIRGFDPAFDANPTDAKPMPAISNLRVPDFADFANIGNVNKPLVPFQNAFFSPGDQLFGQAFGTYGPAMYFGQGPTRDYGYDGDVIYHEFGHAVINATLALVPTPHLDKYGLSVSNGGMNEGMADFLAAAVSGDPDMGEYAAKDIDANLSWIRSLANPDKAPEAIGGEVHQDATFFSASLWDVRSTLTPEDQAKFDLAIYTALAATPAPADLGYEDLATIFVDQVTKDLGATAGDPLKAAFEARGVLPECKRVLEYAGKTLTGPKELQNLWFAPSSANFMTGLSGDYAPGIVQVHYALPANTTEVTVTFDRVLVGANPLMQPTPLEPALLTKFGADPITFDDFTPVTPVAGTEQADLTNAGDTFTAKIVVPAGTTDLHIMVANAGQTDGAYTNINLTSVQSPDNPGTGGAGGAGGGDGTGGNQVNPPNPNPTDDGGCGCAVPGDSEGPASALALGAVGAALALLRRRRSNSIKN